MNREIERKFLLKDDKASLKGIKSWEMIEQGYLKMHSPVVRIRTYGKTGYITIKYNRSESGLGVDEYEYKIPLVEALQMLSICKGRIKKCRYLYTAEDGHVWELDEFYLDNDGLVVAEIELESEDEKFTIPDFIGKEVTGDPKYFNNNLIETPYKDW